MVKNKLRQELTTLAESQGAKVESITLSKSTHVRITLTAPDGRSKTFTCGASSSDVRATKKRKMDFRKFAKGVY